MLIAKLTGYDKISNVCDLLSFGSSSFLLSSTESGHS